MSWEKKNNSKVLIENIVQKFLGEGVSIKKVTQSGHGANSRIFRVETEKDVFALKFYRRGKDNFNDRLNAEKLALTLFKKHGISSIPSIYGEDLINNCVLIEWVDGKVISSPTKVDLKQSIDFLKKVDSIKNDIELIDFAKATEACLSASELISQVEARISKLKQSDSIYLYNLFDSQLLPLFEEVVEWVKSEYMSCDMSIFKDLEIKDQTLSVVDFGFHNALKKNNGEIVFIDFEYFGLDDPVKLVSDTLLHPHPLMNLRHDYKKEFFNKTKDFFMNDCMYSRRIKILYPLYAFRWCTIMLNPFLPDYIFVDSNSNNENQKKIIQNQKIKEVSVILNKIKNNYHLFPF
jgi:thiamine kinase-like enzyme